MPAAATPFIPYPAQPTAVLIVNSDAVAIRTYVDEDGLLIIPTDRPVTGIYCHTAEL